ncbi:MAG: hypothetical protein KDG89_02350 [Geminicoccaceae bacterium]|nr:hypothetical protein [Geminicoccaceae bacterium]
MRTPVWLCLLAPLVLGACVVPVEEDDSWARLRGDDYLSVPEASVGGAYVTRRPATVYRSRPYYGGFWGGYYDDDYNRPIDNIWEQRRRQRAVNEAYRRGRIDEQREVREERRDSAPVYVVPRHEAAPVFRGRRDVGDQREVRRERAQRRANSGGGPCVFGMANDNCH